ncbi:MAG: hypothetical protein LPK03_08460 [Pontibacter sp.]|nr:hypothetical protein [Pontibacter sp.]
MDDFFLGFGLIGMIFGLLLFIVYIWSIVWAYKDAEQRGKPGWIVAIVVAFLAWPLGLLLWLLIRPNDRRYYQP